ncbi:MAG: glutamyl-tRNA reductase [Methanohalobium sp.]|uniref:glutamyl-tRNA reductase n=1 Tax=Methanohalobium sp. TaxID=2837493 RepID=UPI00397DEFFC
MVITHTKASIEEMEKAWHGDIEYVLKSLYSHEHVHECAVLKTCNRVEVYVVSPKASSVLFHFAKEMGASSHIVEFYDHEDSLKHLLRLASGLESMIVGEDQILGQVKDLYVTAKNVGTIGPALDTAFSKAIQVGKRVRTETRINKGSVSIGSAAVDLAEEILGGLTGKKILVIGTGEMGTLVTRALAHKDMEVVYLANRTFETAKQLAEEIGGDAVLFDNIDECVKNADVVISATAAPHYVLRKSTIGKAMENRDKELLLIDIATPRDIEPEVSDISHVKLHNIDSLRRINEKNMEMRRGEAKKAEVMIDEEFTLLTTQYKRQKADGLISQLYGQVHNVRKREKQRAINRLSSYHTIGDIESEVLDDLTHSIVNKILAEPTKKLRRAAENDEDELMDVASQLFNLDSKK